MSPLLVPLVACLLLLTGCGGVEGSGDKGFVSGTGQVTQVAPADRGQPIELSGERLDGGSLNLADLRGTPVVVNVWGSWCTYCRDEAPEIVGAAEELGQDARFVGINLRDADQAQAQGYERTFGIDFPSFWSPDGKAMLAFDGTLTPSSIPSTVVLDDQGRVAASIIGRLPSKTTLVEVVRDVVKESARG